MTGSTDLNALATLEFGPTSDGGRGQTTLDSAGQRVIDIAVMPGASVAEQLDAAVVLGQEAYRSGDEIGDLTGNGTFGAEDMQLQTQDAVLAHTQMALRMVNDSMYSGVMGSVLSADTNLQSDISGYQKAQESGTMNMASFNSYVDSSYDETRPDWRWTVNTTTGQNTLTNNGTNDLTKVDQNGNTLAPTVQYQGGSISLFLADNMGISQPDVLSALGAAHVNYDQVANDGTWTGLGTTAQFSAADNSSMDSTLGAPNIFQKAGVWLENTATTVGNGTVQAIAAGANWLGTQATNVWNGATTAATNGFNYGYNSIVSLFGGQQGQNQIGALPQQSQISYMTAQQTKFDSSQPWSLTNPMDQFTLATQVRGLTDITTYCMVTSYVDIGFYFGGAVSTSNTPILIQQLKNNYGGAGNNYFDADGTVNSQSGAIGIVEMFANANGGNTSIDVGEYTTYNEFLKSSAQVAVLQFRSADGNDTHFEPFFKQPPSGFYQIDPAIGRYQNGINYGFTGMVRPVTKQ